MAEDSLSVQDAKAILGRLRSMTLLADQQEKRRRVCEFLDSLTRPALIVIMEVLGVCRWDQEKKRLVEKTADEWEERAPHWVERLPDEFHWRLLWKIEPKLYREPPSPSAPAHLQSAPEAVAAMAARRGKGQGIRHHRDVVWIEDRGKWTGSMEFFMGRKKEYETVDEIAARKRRHHIASMRPSTFNDPKFDPDGGSSSGKSWEWK